MAGIESIEHLRRELKREQQRTANLNFDSLSGSVGDDAGAAPLFLRKTFKMIDACPAQLGGWSAAGDTFLVRDPDAFSATAIPQYFRHSNFSSFVRQLNFYGFRKVKTDKHGLQRKAKGGDVNKVWEFRHPLFKRGQPALLNEMRKKGDYVDSVEVAALRGEIMTLRNRCDSMTTTVDRLCSTVEVLMGRIEVYEAREASRQASPMAMPSPATPVTAMDIVAPAEEHHVEPPRKRRALVNNVSNNMVHMAGNHMANNQTAVNQMGVHQMAVNQMASQMAANQMAANRMGGNMGHMAANAGHLAANAGHLAANAGNRVADTTRRMAGTPLARIDSRNGVAAVMEMLEMGIANKGQGGPASNDPHALQRRFSLANSEDGGFALFRLPSGSFATTEFDPVALGLVDASELPMAGKEDDLQFFEEVSTLLGDAPATAG